MKIVGLSTRLIEFDCSSRYKDGKIPAGRPKTWRYPLLTLHTDEGVEGYSMAYGPHGDGMALTQMLEQIYAPLLIDENPLHSERIWRKLHQKQRHLYNQSDALMGVVDVAVWDLKGKLMGQSLSGIFGLCREKLPCYASAHSETYTEEEVFAEAQRKKQAGFHGYKLQVRDGPAQDIPRLRAAREAVGPDFPLMQDPNAAYTYDEALLVGETLEKLGYLWYEEPLRDQQLLLLRRLQAKLRVPLLVGETARFDDFHAYLHDGAFSLVRGDVLIKGGITGLRKLMGAAEVFGVNLEIHTANTPLLDIAHLHVASASPNTRFIETHHPIFRFGIKNNPLEPDAEGYVYAPPKPGLGVELDWDWIDAHTIQET
jgi:L-alanine-DL-glutamate epimerase-like enolase superfamily enzyme